MHRAAKKRGKIERYLEIRLWNSKKKKPEARLPKTEQLLQELKRFYKIPVEQAKVNLKFRKKIKYARVRISKKWKLTQERIDTWHEISHLPKQLIKQWVLCGYIPDNKTALMIAAIITDWDRFKDN